MMEYPYYDETYVSARGLYELLEIRSYYFDWMSRVIKRLGLVEGKDYFIIYEPQSGRGRHRKSHLLPPEIAKEILVTEQKGKGREVRKEVLKEGIR